MEIHQKNWKLVQILRVMVIQILLKRIWLML